MKPPKICILTCLLGDAYKDEVKFGIKSKQIYCDRNNYDFIVSEENDYSNITNEKKQCGWLKVYKLLELCLHYDYIFVSDADVTMMNHSIRLEEIILEHMNNKLLMITKDHNDYNSGNIIVKGKSANMIKYIQEWVKLLPQKFDYVGYQEQPALLYMIHNTDFKSHIQIVEQRLINSYTDDTCHKKSQQFKEGDLLTHYAGYDVYGIPMKEKMKRDFEWALSYNRINNS